MTDAHQPAPGSHDYPQLGFNAWAILCAPTEAATAETIQQHVPAHLDWLLELEQQGVVVISGPLVSGPDTGPGSGIIVVRAGDEAAASAIAAADPIVKAGLRTSTVHRWQINEGSLNLRLTLSTRQLLWI